MTDEDKRAWDKVKHSFLGIFPAKIAFQAGRDSKTDGWCFDMDKPKPLGKDFAVLKNGRVYSPCTYHAAGDIDVGEAWIVWNRAADEYFDQIIEPEAWMVIEIPSSPNHRKEG